MLLWTTVAKIYGAFIITQIIVSKIKKNRVKYEYNEDNNYQMTVNSKGNRLKLLPRWCFFASHHNSSSMRLIKMLTLPSLSENNHGQHRNRIVILQGGNEGKGLDLCNIRHDER